MGGMVYLFFCHVKVGGGGDIKFVDFQLSYVSYYLRQIGHNGQWGEGGASNLLTSYAIC